MSNVTRLDAGTYEATIRLHINPDGLSGTLMTVASEEDQRLIAEQTLGDAMAYLNGTGRETQLTFAADPVVWPPAKDEAEPADESVAQTA